MRIITRAACAFVVTSVLAWGGAVAANDAPADPAHGATQADTAAQPSFAEQPNLKDAAIATGVLAKMMNATSLAGLDNPEIKVGPLTLLAPSDAAFEALPADIRDKLLAPDNRAILTDLLLFHAIPGLYPTERLLNARVRNYTIQAIDGSDVEIVKRRKTGEIDIAGAKIVRSDVMASDGIIHVIDKVLIPKPVMDALMAPPALPSTEIAAEGDR
jgi:uncharacterized surface protein with fasciclin (FAS1) repeats